MISKWTRTVKKCTSSVASQFHYTSSNYQYPFMTSKKTLLIDFWKIFKRSYLKNGDDLETHTWLLFFNGLYSPLVGILDQNIRQVFFFRWKSKKKLEKKRKKKFQRKFRYRSLRLKSWNSFEECIDTMVVHVWNINFSEGFYD